eukprot:GDKH01001876.1.p8 GENE.GDKH01001876.1~~GDKH01001876.1.p8  ORF type:complete len:51 (-),score=12.41 GDKH01001876.1:52-204(-)
MHAFLHALHRPEDERTVESAQALLVGVGCRRAVVGAVRYFLFSVLLVPSR